MSRYDRETAALDGLRAWAQRHPVGDVCVAALVMFVGAWLVPYFAGPVFVVACLLGFNPDEASPIELATVLSGSTVIGMAEMALFSGLLKPDPR